MVTVVSGGQCPDGPLYFRERSRLEVVIGATCLLVGQALCKDYPRKCRERYNTTRQRNYAYYSASESGGIQDFGMLFVHKVEELNFNGWTGVVVLERTMITLQLKTKICNSTLETEGVSWRTGGNQQQTGKVYHVGWNRCPKPASIVGRCPAELAFTKAAHVRQYHIVHPCSWVVYPSS